MPKDLSIEHPFYLLFSDNLSTILETEKLLDRDILDLTSK
jgi:hypothetical protein